MPLTLRRDDGTVFDLGNADVLAEALKVLIEPHRLGILRKLRAAGEDGLVVWQVTEAMQSLAQPTITHHLKKLWGKGLVDRYEQGTHVWYSINTTNIAILLQALNEEFADLTLNLE